MFRRLFFLVCVVAFLDEIIAEIHEEKIFMTSINCGLNNRDVTSSSILISGTEYSKKGDGLNIVVYDIKNSFVVHARSFPDPNTREFVKFFASLQPGLLVLGTSQILCNSKTATDFTTQRSVLNGLRRLYFNTHALKPILFSSAVFAYCKESCYENVTSSIDLPYSKVTDFKKGPILLSFRITSQRKTINVAATGKSSPDSYNSIIHIHHSTLYAIIISCSLIICLTIFAVSWFLIKRRRTGNRDIDHTIDKSFVEGKTKKRNNDASCELLYISKEKNNCYQQRYEPTTSARLFSLYTEPDSKPATMEGFASYVKVETKDRELVYKIPSGVSKHDPPLHPPQDNIQHSIKTSSSSEYLSPHDYERPGYNGHISVYEEVHEVHEEYMSLEPPYYEDYNEPIYDDCET